MRALLVVAMTGCGAGMGSMTADDVAPPVDGMIGETCPPAPAEASGEGTYYAADGTGNCSFDASPNDLLVAAMNHTDYGTADWCGACLLVTGPHGTVTVRIVDQCPGCAQGDLDLSPEAFELLSPLSAGRIPITWHEVACEETGPVGYHFKAGDTKFYTPIQLRDHRYPIAKLEVQQSGAYVEIPRVDYNYFVPSSGLGVGPFALRVTDTRGHVLEDSGIALGDDVTRPGAGQFSVCP